MARAWRIFGAALVISTYFVTSPIAYGAFAVLGLFPTRDPIRRARHLQFVMMCGFRTMHAVLRWFWILDFAPRYVEGEIPSSPCVLVANHPTLTDISALLATERGLVFPVKPDLFRSFWARPLLAQAHHFEGAGPGAFTTAGQVIDEAVDRLARGYRVVVFPEGTRSPPKGLHPFGRAAFEIAVRAGVPVIPIVITCTPRWLSGNHGFLDPPAEVPKLRLRALPAVHPEKAGSSSRTLRDIVFQQITSELGGAERP